MFGFVLVPALAWAGSSARGQAAFEFACATCHNAPQTSSAGQRRETSRTHAPSFAGPDLTNVYAKRQDVGMRAWLHDPKQVDSHLRCDPRLLTTQDEANVWAFLRTRLLPEPLPQGERVKRELDRQIALQKEASGPPRTGKPNPREGGRGGK